MKLYYNELADIMCIVEGDKIYKFIGDFCPFWYIKEYATCTNEWYAAEVRPDIYPEFVLIGEL